MRLAITFAFACGEAPLPNPALPGDPSPPVEPRTPWTDLDVAIPAQRNAFDVVAVEDGVLTLHTAEPPSCVGCPDLDGDGLSDRFEALILDAFHPVVRVTSDEPFLTDPAPVLHQIGRVYPVSPSIVRALIAIAWHRDYGSECGGLSAHDGDPERVAIELDVSAGRVAMARAYTAAHEHTATDRSHLYERAELAEIEVTPDRRWAVYASKAKHATYASEARCLDASALPCLRESCSAGAELRPGVLNAGERSAPLADDLTDVGFPGESAWADRSFCGGGDGPCSASLLEKLTIDPFGAGASRPPEWEPLEPFDPGGPLCDIPAGYVDMGGDPVNPPCRIAGGRASDRAPLEAPPELRVVAWNVRFGVDAQAVLDAFGTEPELAGADVILLSEVARHDRSSNPPDIDQAQLLAEALAMDWAFAVEWDRREDPDGGGEHGIAVLSKYPIGNAALIRHTPQNDWWAEGRRYGGRATLAADLLIGDRLVRVYSSHLDTRGGQEGRAVQGSEIRTDADRPDAPAIEIAGGDLNTWTCNPIVSDCSIPPAAETVVEDFLSSGWADGTAGFNGHTQLGEGFFPQRLDWIFVRGAGATPGRAVEVAGSDHLPVFSSIRMD